MSAIAESLVKKAMKNLSNVNLNRGQQHKADKRIEKLKKQIQDIEEMISDLAWDSACAGNEANNQEGCFQHNMEMARREFCKDMEGDSAAKMRAWGEFLKANGWYGY